MTKALNAPKSLYACNKQRSVVSEGRSRGPSATEDRFDDMYVCKKGTMG